jgi:hypothetical protein
VTLLARTARKMRRFRDIGPEHEEGRLHAVGGERVEHAAGVLEVRAIVEGEHDLAVPEP